MNAERNIQGFINKEKQIQPNPFLATRIMARIETPQVEPASRWRPVVLTVCLVLTIVVGIGLGKSYQPTFPSYTDVSINDSDIEGLAYFNLNGDE
ncbi:MAG: hypothetical protein PHX49_06395 [Bacteroidales bacterium]|jgi:hypothetical protein|nr:hypothetical protein [Bacteroidales bacterium]